MFLRGSKATETLSTVVNSWHVGQQPEALVVDADGTTLRHIGSNDVEYAAVGAHSFGVMKIPYFEITVSSLAEGCVAVGVGPKTFRMKGSFPGWRKDSFGYHSDDGQKYCANDAENGLPFGSSFAQGDTIGCGIYKGSVYFTKNGAFVGVAFPCGQPLNSIYPVLGLDYPSVIQTNFGSAPFQYNPDHVKYEAEITGVGIHSLPREIMVEIYMFCVDMPEDAIPVALVCRQWRDTIFDSTSNLLWERLSKLDWPYLAQQNVKMRNWFTFYRGRRQIAHKIKDDDGDQHQYFLPVENCGLIRKKDLRSVPIRVPYPEKTWMKEAKYLREEDESCLSGDEGETIEGQLADFEEIEKEGGYMPSEDGDEIWERKCPVMLGNLPKAASNPHAASFACDVCNETVYRVTSMSSLQSHVAQGHCVTWHVPPRQRIVPLAILEARQHRDKQKPVDPDERAPARRPQRRGKISHSAIVRKKMLKKKKEWEKEKRRVDRVNAIQKLKSDPFLVKSEGDGITEVKEEPETL